jgi:putative solute:sodium symporter small subunit
MRAERNCHASTQGKLPVIMDDEQRRLHRRRTKRLALAVFYVLLFLVVVVPLNADFFTRFIFLRFSLGFFMVAHGIILGIIAAVAWFLGSQEKIDRDFNVTTHG